MTKQIDSLVHPHGRGERTNRGNHLKTFCGSSPRAWGTRIRSRKGLQRFTVHPHGRGERNLSRSSPRAERCIKSRFIPTGVGNASPITTGLVSTAVHPHGRGERVGAALEIDETRGSSPRAWGTRPAATQARLPQRFIPTGVGNATFHISPCEKMSVHPHGRGERHPRACRAQLDSGSSPRAWGTRVQRAVPFVVHLGSSPRAWGTHFS